MLNLKLTVVNHTPLAVWRVVTTIGLILLAWNSVVAPAGAIAAEMAPAVSPMPNVILVLVDDLGWTDLSCQGSKFYETPHIDALARSGMRFTHGYSACTVCSPSRAAILTGRYPARLHLTDWIAGHVRADAKLQVPDWKKYLDHDEVTLAESFAHVGYATGCFGKWHLGPDTHRPETQGFRLNVGGTHVGQPPSYFFPYSSAKVGLPGLGEGPKGEYLTDRLTLEVEQFLEQHQQQPFFIYLPHYTVHTPLQAKQEKIARYQTKAQQGGSQANATYAAMIESLDESIGRIMAKLASLKLTENTIVVFTSDNGGLTLRNITSNEPLRAGKGSAYEGGVRVPFIVSWPGKIAAGSTTETPAIGCDLFPTLAELTGAGGKGGPRCDGVSLAPVLLGKGPVQREALYWHYPHYHPGGATPYSAIRAGDYRLVEFFEDGRRELYNLARDPSEKHDLAATEPELRDRLHQQLVAWRNDVDAQLPTPRVKE
jgi:arylsulfatase A-like enzyme